MSDTARGQVPRCADLTVPSEDSVTVRTLLSRYLTRQYRDLLRLRLSQQSGEQSALFTVQKHCKALAAEQPGPVLSALRRPTIGGLVRFLASPNIGNGEAPMWVAQLTGLLYAELAIAGTPPPPIVLAPTPKRFILAGAKTAIVLPDSVASCRMHEEGVTYVDGSSPTTILWQDIAEGSTPVSQPAALPVSGSVSLALADDSPLADQETHPDKEGNALDLGGKSSQEWVNGMRAGLELVRTGLPTIADEIELLIQQLVPVGFDKKKHLSASYQEMIGTIYLSLHPEPMTLAEALIHEHSHNKINMLWTMAPVIENAFSPSYPSPFRPDLRPLHGVLLGVHAFLPVEHLYENLGALSHPITSDPNFERRRKAIRKNNREACETLAQYAEASAEGQSVMDEIMTWNEHFEQVVDQ